MILTNSLLSALLTYQLPTTEALRDVSSSRGNRQQLVRVVATSLGKQLMVNTALCYKTRAIVVDFFCDTPKHHNGRHSTSHSCGLS